MKANEALQGQLFPPTQPWAHGQGTLSCLQLPTLAQRGPRLGSACAPPQLAKAWPSPNLVSLPRRLLALMTNFVISTGWRVGGKRQTGSPAGYLSLLPKVVAQYVLRCDH